MKRETLIIGITFSIACVISVQAQGSFQNLDFEMANPISAGNPAYPNMVTAASALPFWAVYYSGAQQSDILYNAISLGATAVSLEGTASEYAPAIDGNYSVLIQGIVPGSTASISQTGLIPASAQSLVFEASTTVPGAGHSPLDLYLGNELVPFMAVGGGANYTLYGANIAAWAGDVEQLTFFATGGAYSSWEIDDIAFSTTAVTPEPSPVVLTGIGGLLFALYRRFAPKRS